MRPAAGLGHGAVPVQERRGVQPGLEGRLVPPPGHHQPGGALVGRLEELEALEAVLVVDRARPGGKPVGELVTAVGRHSNRIDLYNRHATDDASPVSCPVPPPPPSAEASEEPAARAAIVRPAVELVVRIMVNYNCGHDHPAAE